MRFTIRLSNYSYFQGLGCDYWTAESTTLNYIGALTSFTAYWIYQAASGPTTINDLVIKIWKTSESTTIPKYSSLYLGPIVDEHDYQYDVGNDILTDITPGIWNGAILENKIHYGGVYYDFGPLLQFPLNTSIAVSILVRNDGQTARLRINYVVWNPSGSVVRDDSYQTLDMVTGECLTYEGPYFSLNAVGEWLVAVSLAVYNGTTWVVVDTWPESGYGVLCTVQSEIPIEHIFSNLDVIYNKV